MSRLRSWFSLFAVVALMWPVAAAAQQTDPEDVEVFTERGYLVFQSEDGLTRYWLDGRVMLDAGLFSGSENELANGMETRRARIAFKSILYGDWAGELDLDFANNELEIKDFWLAYIGVDNLMIKAGNQKVQNSLEELTTSRWLTFMERGQPNVFTVGRRVGVSATRWGDNWSVLGGLYTQEPGGEADPGEQLGNGRVARATFAPLLDDERVIHLGASYSSFTPDAGDDMEVRFRQRPGVHFTDRLVNTGKVSDVERYSFLGFEGAVRHGSLSAQGEYVIDKMSRLNGMVDAEFSGWYGFVSWFATGEQRTYVPNEGEFGAIYPEGDNGALEFAVRYSTLDLTDAAADVLGGQANNLTFGANWYANNNVRIMANFIIVDNDENADGDGDYVGNDDFKVFAIRLQYLF